MEDKNKKKDEFVIINKFKENSSVDVKKSIEKVFKEYLKYFIIYKWRRYRKIIFNK